MHYLEMLKMISSENLNNNFVFVPTIQHTGTWFLLDLFKKYEEANVFVHAKETENGLGENFKFDFSKKIFFQIHFPPFAHYSYEDITKKTKNDILEIKEKDLKDLTESLDMIQKIVIPIRDPLRSMITRQKRHPELNHNYIVDGMTFLSSYKNINKIFLFPVDDTDNKDVHVERVNNLIEYVNLPMKDYSNQYALDWKKSNHVGDRFGLEDMYLNKNLEALLKVMPDEIKYLKSKENVLRPFLEKCGYKKLIWWDNDN